MTHLYFLFYSLSLLSGFLLLGAYHNDPKIVKSSGFKPFIHLYLVMSAFLFLAASCLYFKVNIPNSEISVVVFQGSIPFFLSMMTFLIFRHDSEKFDAPVYLRFRPLLYLVLCYGITSSLLIWTLVPPFTIHLIVISILLLVLGLWSNFHFHAQYKKGVVPAKYNGISIFMITVSLLLPLLEVSFWSEQLAEVGLSISFPLIYVINNGMSWYFRDILFLNQGKDITNIHIPDVLTEKERQVALAITEGLSNKQIAARLHMSPSTVKNHLYTIYKKLNINSRTSLISTLMADKS